MDIQWNITFKNSEVNIYMLIWKVLQNILLGDKTKHSMIALIMIITLECV